MCCFWFGGEGNWLAGRKTISFVCSLSCFFVCLFVSVFVCFGKRYMGDKGQWLFGGVWVVFCVTHLRIIFYG